MPFTHPGLAVKMDCFRKLGFFNEKKKRTADHYWIISLIQSDFTGKRCEFVNVNFFLGGSSMSIQGINEMYDTAREFNRNKYLAVIYYLYGLINLMYYKILNN